MIVSEREYNKARQKRSDRVKQILALVSIVSFGGSGIFGIAQLFNSPAKQPVAADIAKSELASQEKGYELVLQREPENQTALEGLVKVRLQMNDAKGAIQPLEKLVKLNRDNQDYKMQLEQVKQKVKTSDR